MESQPQNPEFRNNPENFHPCSMLTNPNDCWYFNAGHMLLASFFIG